jgi:hypothetical protein
MQTKVGLHYHIRVGPESVVLFERPPLAGPYYDIVFDDFTTAHDTFVDLVNSHWPDQLDDDDRVSSYEYFSDMLEYSEPEDLQDRGIDVDLDPLKFALQICSQCRPKGNN